MVWHVPRHPFPEQDHSEQAGLIRPRTGNVPDDGRGIPGGVERVWVHGNISRRDEICVKDWIGAFGDFFWDDHRGGRKRRRGDTEDRDDKPRGGRRRREQGTTCQRRSRRRMCSWHRAIVIIVFFFFVLLDLVLLLVLLLLLECWLEISGS